MWDQAGFMNDSITNEPSRVTNTVAVGGEDRSRPTMPVSLSQIAKLTRPDEGLVIHGQKAAVVTVVARIVEVLESSLHKLQYMIDDYTSGPPLEVQFIRSDAGLPVSDSGLSMFNEDGNQTNPDEAQVSELRVNDYMRVFGQVKFSSEKPQIMAYKILPVVDPNEIIMHVLEVVKETMYAEKSNSGTLTVNNVARSDRGVPASAVAAAQDSGNISNLHRHILQIIQKLGPSDGRGLHINDIVSSLKGVPRDEVMEGIQFLHQEGHLWNGDSDESWCVG